MALQEPEDFTRVCVVKYAAYGLLGMPLFGGPWPAAHHPTYPAQLAQAGMSKT
jgi:hypothetical protein